MSDFTPTELKTKAVYVEQHKAYLRDVSIFERFYRVALDPDSYGLTAEDIRGKQVADIGCGNTAYFQKAMFDLGAEHVTCVDVGEEWMPELQSALDGLGVPRSFYTMVSGSAFELPLGDAEFDLVTSNGVLMHLESKFHAGLAFEEHARITKPNGFFYGYFSSSRTGLLDAYVLPALRTAYAEQPAFKEYIDTLTPDRLHSDLDSIIEGARENDPEIQQPMRAVAALLTLDTITFWQNALQVPVNLGASLDEEWVSNQYAENGFSDARRVPAVYWHRNDIRRFMAPVHYTTENPISRLLNGDGHLKMIGRKGR